MKAKKQVIYYLQEKNVRIIFFLQVAGVFCDLRSLMYLMNKWSQSYGGCFFY